jgi:putative nucleotidyltransferase with HDIG domain
VLIKTDPRLIRPTGTLTAPIRVAEVISALSFALDLTEGQPMGHSVRACVFGMRLAEEIGVPLAARSDLYYALLMKDAGCSSNAARMVQILGTDDIKAKGDVKTTDWTRVGWESLQYALSHVRTSAPFLERVRALFSVAINQKENAKNLVQIRCERGAAIARRIGFAENTADAIHSLDELWNGTGQPDGMRGEEIPLFSRIMNLAQTVDVFYTARGQAAAVEVARKRSGRWFDPALVRAFCSLAKKESLWVDVANAAKCAVQLEPPGEVLEASEANIDNICLAFADVIDAKSPFTYRHSAGVAGTAVAIGRTLAMSEPEVTLLRRAALLHDIGKLGVSNSILDKPGKLTDDEWAIVRKHPSYSHQVLKRIPGFEDLSEIAASHHEKLDGSGYFRSMQAAQLSLPARILVVSDIYDALAARRPYRDALPLETVFEIMRKDAPRALDSTCFEALKCSTDVGHSVTLDLLRLSANIQTEQEKEKTWILS